MYTKTRFSLLVLAMFAAGGAYAASSVRMLGTTGLNNNTNTASNGVAAPVRNATGVASTRKSTMPLRTRTIPAATTTNTVGSNRISIAPAKLVPVKSPVSGGGSQAIKPVDIGGTGTGGGASVIGGGGTGTDTMNQIIGRFDTIENQLDAKLDAAALNDYYTKTEIDEISDAFYTTGQIDDKVTDLNTRINNLSNELNGISETVSNERITGMETSLGNQAAQIVVLQQDSKTLYDAATDRRLTVYVVDDFNDTVLTSSESGQSGEGI